MPHSHMPPVPPESRSKNAPVEQKDSTEALRDTSKPKGPPENLAEEARQGNIAQNTHHQGYQQDR